MHTNAINETDNRYGKLVVIKPAASDSQGRLNWVCLCDCGNRTVVAGTNLRRDKTTSCGCHQIAMAKVNLFKRSQERQNKLFGGKPFSKTK